RRLRLLAGKAPSSTGIGREGRNNPAGTGGLL
ncbi:uncharacterized protein METZ01_LOCUS255376, partial [marine metagenome]